MRKFVIATLLLGSTLATADSIEEKRQKADSESLLKHEVQSANKACKTTVPETDIIDWSTFKVIVDDKNSSAGSVCKYVVYGMGNLCRGDKIAQETVAKDVKKFVCKGDSTEDI